MLASTQMVIIRLEYVHQQVAVTVLLASMVKYLWEPTQYTYVANEFKEVTQRCNYDSHLSLLNPFHFELQQTIINQLLQDTASLETQGSIY